MVTGPRLRRLLNEAAETPPGALSAARVALADVHRYPDEWARGVLARWWGVAPDRLFVDAGASGVLRTLCDALAVPGDRRRGRETGLRAGARSRPRPRA